MHHARALFATILHLTLENLVRAISHIIQFNSLLITIYICGTSAGIDQHLQNQNPHIHHHTLQLESKNP